MKERWLILFLSAAMSSGVYCQPTAAASVRCMDTRFKDSLLKKWVDSGADKLRDYYNNPRWSSFFDSILAVCPQVAEAYQLKAIPALKYADLETTFRLNDRAVFFDTLGFLDYRAFLKCIFTKDYDGALTDFRLANTKSPGGVVMDHTYYFYEALCFLCTGRYKEADAGFEQDINSQTGGDTSKPAHFNSLLYRGILYYQMGNRPAAEKWLKKCLALYEQLPEANYYLGKLYLQEKNTQLATKYFSRAREAMKTGYSFNEDNRFYVNYPFQITTSEVDAALLLTR